MAFSWRLVFIVAALILFVLAAFNVPTPPRFNLVAGGLALLTLAFFFTG
jgi:hypothetical protein